MLYLLIYFFIGLVLAGLVAPKAIENALEAKGVPESEHAKFYVVGFVFLAVFMALLWPVVIVTAFYRAEG
ncbi:hypothetical protein [Paludifilum halophilum]|uniref:Uncharacterized protein n=1 Tax=Paludifilum halophilum TaxID=1642702 RepID=A0A235B8F8_9BACL|nr:hypothetical protein [Paludifilum halophilum]OYD08566.1 hypothetical protein CHM34_06995 [Paludifilum halophilum]